MKDIMARRNVGIVRRFASTNVLLALDYDGTLAPIVDDPRRASLRTRTRRLLAEVARLYPCVVISGRAEADVRRRLRGLGIVQVIGNHGIERSPRTAGLARTVRHWTPVLQARIGSIDGVFVEDKTLSLAVHYRLARQKRRAKAAIHDAAAGLSNVRVVPGKMVLNLVPAGAPHKGTALRALRARLRCDTAIYVGDDDTDEDVFALAEPDRLLGIRVQKNQRSRAEFFIETQEEIDELLALLRASRLSTDRRV